MDSNKKFSIMTTVVTCLILLISFALCAQSAEDQSNFEIKPAYNPVPVNKAQWIPTEVKLKWKAASGSQSFKVYFGERVSDVVDGAEPVQEVEKTSYTTDALEEGTRYYWRVDEVMNNGEIIKGDIWFFTTSGRLNFRVDLAVPQWDNPLKPRSATAKKDWLIWSAPRWKDMYMHDEVWFPGGADKDLYSEYGGILDSGVKVLMVAGGQGKGLTGTVHAKGLSRGSLAGDKRPYGEVNGNKIYSDNFLERMGKYEANNAAAIKTVGDPIANTYYYACDWAGPIWGDIALLFEDLPAGEYKLISYHNYFEPVKSSERNSREAKSQMPPMPSITVHPLTEKLIQSQKIEHIPRDQISREEVEKNPDIEEIDLDDPYLKWERSGIEGNPNLYQLNLPTPDPDYKGEGVKAIENAYDVPVTSTLKDEEVSTSTVRFSTDGHRVMVIYEAPGWEYKDPARGDRPGGRGVLNAFELKLENSNLPQSKLAQNREKLSEIIVKAQTILNEVSGPEIIAEEAINALEEKVSVALKLIEKEEPPLNEILAEIDSLNEKINKIESY